MEAQGDGQEFIDELEAALSDKGRQVMSFISAYYQAEHAEINPTFRRRSGVNLPSHANYAPLTKQPMKIEAGMMSDPITGGLVPEGSYTPGSLKTRRPTTTGKIVYKDALQVFLAHKQQINHWLAYGDFAADAAAILGNRDVVNAVTARAGNAAMNALLKHVQGFAGGGFRDAAASLATASLGQSIASRAATIHLAGSIGTRLIQATQAAAAIHEMPTASFVYRFSKLWSGQMGDGLWDAFNSPFIQRRLKEMPPVVRQAIAGLRSRKPNAVKHWTGEMARTITGSDALFAASTYAIIKDYQMALGRKQGLTGEALEAFATKEAIRGTERVAQPTRMGARSVFENTAQSAYKSMFMAYISEARQKIALAAYELVFQPITKDNVGQKMRTAFLVWGIGGIMANVIRSAWRDWQDDDDEWTDKGIFGFMDDKNWNLKRMLVASLAGPVNAVPFLGQVIEDMASGAVGAPVNSGNILGNIGKGANAARNIATGKPFDKDEPVEETLKQVNALMAGLGFFSDTLAATAAVSDLVSDTAKLIDAAYTDQEEASGQSRRASNRAKREAKED